MNTTLFYLAFLLLSVALAVIAFGPTWREWRHPTDTAALQVLPQYTTDIEHFSDRFRALVQAQSVVFHILARENATLMRNPDDLALVLVALLMATMVGGISLWRAIVRVRAARSAVA